MTTSSHDSTVYAILLRKSIGTPPLNKQHQITTKINSINNKTEMAIKKDNKLQLVINGQTPVLVNHI